MYKTKYWSIMLIFCIMTLLVSVCSSSASPSLTAIDSKETFTKAYQKFLSLKSYHMNLDVTSSLYVEGKIINTVIQGEFDVHQKPMMGKNIVNITMDIDSKKDRKQLVQYVEESGDQIIIYSYVDNHWIKQSMPNYNPFDDFDNYIKAIISVTPISEDADSIVYEVIASGSYLKDNIKHYIAATGKNTQLTSDLLKDVGNFKYTITIDKKVSTISKMNIDLSDFMSKIIARMAESPDIPAEKRKIFQDMLGNIRMILNVTFSQFNRVKNITIPQEVKSTAQNHLIQTQSSNSFTQNKSTGDGSQPPAAGKAIKIGVNLELSGSVGSFGQSVVRGMHMAANEINRLGGIKGRRLDLIVEDNTTQPLVALNMTKKLIEQDNVVAILGATASTDTLAFIQLANDRGIPVITPTGTNPAVILDRGKVREYAFQACFADPYQGKIAARFAFDSLNGRKAAIITDMTSVYSRTISATFEKAFTALGGEIVMKQGYVQRQQDYSDLVKRLQDISPDVIFVPGYYEEAGMIVKQARQSGVAAPFLGGDGWDTPRLVAIAGADALNNAYFINHFSVADPDPQVIQFVSSYKKEYRAIPDALSALGYDAVMILKDAIERAETADPENIRDALAATRNSSLVTGYLSYSADHEAIKSAVVIEFKDGKRYFKERVNP